MCLALCSRNFSWVISLLMLPGARPPAATPRAENAYLSNLGLSAFHHLGMPMSNYLIPSLVGHLGR